MHHRSCATPVGSSKRVPGESHVLRYLVTDTPSPCCLAEQAPYPASALSLSCLTLTERYLLEIIDLTY
jgi:hypothetical protein